MMLTNQERQAIYARHFEQYHARHVAALFNADEIVEGFADDCERDCRGEQIGNGLSRFCGWAFVAGTCGVFWWYLITSVGSMIR